LSKTIRHFNLQKLFLFLLLSPALDCSLSIKKQVSTGVEVMGQTCMILCRIVHLVK